jgi:hypothetical protein
VTSPTIPLTRNSHPKRIVTASVAIGGKTTAVAPQNKKHHAFDQKEHPVLMESGRRRTLNVLNAGLLGGHESLQRLLPPRYIIRRRALLV